MVLRSWHPTSDWVDSAQILISVRSISIDATVRPVGTEGGGEREFMVFRLEPVEGAGEFVTEQVSSDDFLLTALLSVCTALLCCLV